MFGKKQPSAPPVPAPSPPTAADRPMPTVIDLTEAAQRARVRVKVLPQDNPLLHMSHEDRMRLYVRIICELVAYGEDDEQPAAMSSPTYAATYGREPVRA